MPRPQAEDSPPGVGASLLCLPKGCRAGAEAVLNESRDRGGRAAAQSRG